MVPRSPFAELLREEKAVRSSLRVGEKPELKYFTTTASTGIVSQYTWNNFDQLGNIAAGTAQNQRLGRVIRLHRMRVVLSPGAQAYDTVLSFVLLKRLDPSISSSDIWPDSGSARSQLNYPNPLCAPVVYHETCKTLAQYAGSAGGTTPSYAPVVLVFDQHWEKGFPVSYDAGGAVIGASPIPHWCVSTTSVSADVAVQYWFTDA